MSDKSIGFIGGGRVTRILLESWKRANALPPDILVSDCNAESFAKLATQFPSVRTTADCRAAASQNLVFLAVHPPVLAEAAGVIKDSLKPAALVVCGATRTLLESGLTPAEVMDLIPVKPLAEMEPQITELYRTRLPGLYQKIKP